MSEEEKKDSSYPRKKLGDIFIPRTPKEPSGKTENLSIAKDPQSLGKIIDSLNEGIVVVDSRTHKILYINDFGARVLGTDKDHLMGKVWDEYISSFVDKRLGGNNCFLLTSSGESLPINIHESAWVKEGREYIIHNFTVKNRIEFYQDIFENIKKDRGEEEGLFLYELDKEGIPAHFLEVNDTACFKLGYSKEELMRIPPLDIEGGNITEKVAFVHRLLANGDVSFDTVHLSKNGEKIPVHIRAHLFSFQGKRVVFSTVTYKAKRQEGEQSLEDVMNKLDRVYEETIAALAYAVEKRDAYTAEHQRRVAKLAVAIAREMKLSPDDMRGIYLAASVHDIGKIYVPAEILTKPSRLTENEFGIIKTHVDIGYEILKGIEFPWPIAEIVLQHHERIDGSGYPRGLSNKDILFEAKILAVADVVEAMSSHRPYRPALGIDRALGEILHKKGILYASEVAEACFNLFERKGFEFDIE